MDKVEERQRRKGTGHMREKREAGGRSDQAYRKLVDDMDANGLRAAELVARDERLTCSAFGSSQHNSGTHRKRGDQHAERKRRCGTSVGMKV
jgi:hypothetical protein